MNTLSKEPIDKKKVLAKAFLNVSNQLNLNQTQIAAIIEISIAVVIQLQTEMNIDPISKQGELALLIIKLFRTLHNLSGGYLDWIRHFLESKNRVTGGIPIKQIETERGLVSVLQFVEAIRH